MTIFIICAVVIISVFILWVVMMCKLLIKQHKKYNPYDPIEFQNVDEKEYVARVDGINQSLDGLNELLENYRKELQELYLDQKTAKNREQLLIDLCFALTLAAREWKQFQAKPKEEVAEWVRKRLKEYGFKTIPKGSSFGVLVSDEENDHT